MKYIAILICTLSTFFAEAQNLVPNPSFEEYYTCPMGAGGLASQAFPYESRIKYWYSMNYTPDYMHYCTGNPEASNYPSSNAWGYQEPYDGEGYVSLISINGVQDEREYIAVELLEPMVIGNTYDVSFYVSDADGGEIEYIDCVSNNIGVKFLVNPPNYWNNEQNNFPLLPDNFAHINMDEILVDSIGWTLVDGVVIADQAYTHLVIGNFFTDENTSYVQTNDAGCESMQFIDKVCVVEQGNDCNVLHNSINSISFKESNIPNIIGMNLDLSAINIIDIKQIQIYDLTGRLCFSENNISSEINVSLLKTGVYCLIIKLKNGLFKKIKILKE